MFSGYLLNGSATLITIVLATSSAFSQSYPTKPIRIVTAEIGGGNDFAARIIAPALGDATGQQVVVENRGGASGAIAAQMVAKSPPDGYTLLLYSGTLWVTPLMRDNVPYDPLKDFAPITLAASSPNLLVVHPSLPVKSVKELIALAKARPGALNYATGGTGTGPHITAEIFKAMAGVDIVRINYKGGGPALNDVIAGHVQLMFPAAGPALSHVQSGRLRALAVTTERLSRLFPGLPTVAAAGLPGFESGPTQVIFAPARTPSTIVTFLNQKFLQVLNTAEVQKRFFDAGVETVGSSPEQLTAYMKSDMARVEKVIKGAGIRLE